MFKLWCHHHTALPIFATKKDFWNQCELPHRNKEMKSTYCKLGTFNNQSCDGCDKYRLWARVKSQDNDRLLVLVTTQGNLYINFDDSEISMLSILTTLTKVDKEDILQRFWRDGQGKAMVEFGSDKEQHGFLFCPDTNNLALDSSNVNNMAVKSGNSW